PTLYPLSLHDALPISGGVPLQASVAAGIISLGDHHGGAIEQCAKLLQESVKAGTAASAIVSDFRTRKQRLPGFGHPWHDRDPRTDRKSTRLNSSHDQI